MFQHFLDLMENVEKENIKEKQKKSEAEKI
jgi:hypothetical protein